MNRSHLTQTLLNYFDAQDIRIREEAYTIDAQLLNLAAIGLDEKNLHTKRELSSRTLNDCPTQIDNFGLYYRIPLDHDYPLEDGQTKLNTCLGTTSYGTSVVNPYDDTLPVPSSYVLDTERQTVSMTNPVLFDITGSGDIINHVWNVQNLGPYSLAIPNKLVFWAENVSGTNMFADIFIQGDEYPKPLFINQQMGASETLKLQSEGYAKSILVWQDISAITIKNLPAGVRLTCWQVPCNLPGVPDPDRPYTSPTFRDKLFDRYWIVPSEDNLLKEKYMMDNFSTLEYIQSYLVPPPVQQIGFGLAFGSFFGS